MKKFINAKNIIIVVSSAIVCAIIGLVAWVFKNR